MFNKLFLLIILTGFCLQAGPKTNPCLQRKRAQCNGVQFGPSEPFGHLELRESFFNQAQLLGTEEDYIDLHYTKLEQAHFHDAVLDYVDMPKTQLGETDFSGLKTKISNTFFTESSGLKALFNEATLEKVEFKDSYFQEAQFHKTRFKNVFFKNTNLSGSDFSKAHFIRAIFDRSDLENTSFQCAILDSVDFAFNKAFKYINLKGADLSKSHLDKTTLHLLKPYFCGTKLEDGHYHSAAGCYVPAGVDSTPYCQEGAVWPKSSHKNIDELPEHIPQPTPILPQPNPPTGNCHLKPGTCEAHSTSGILPGWSFKKRHDCERVAVKGHSACYQIQEHTGFECVPYQEDFCLGASSAECGNGEYKLCHH